MVVDSFWQSSDIHGYVNNNDDQRDIRIQFRDSTLTAPSSCLASTRAISRKTAPVFLRFENGTQAVPNDRVIVRYHHPYLLRGNLERCFHDGIGTVRTMLVP
jgi:hypothetical protein